MGKYPNILHHKRVGEPSFNLVKSLFSHFLTTEFVESFKCDIRQLSNHHYTSYLIYSKRCNFLFNLLTLMFGSYFRLFFSGVFFHINTQNEKKWANSASLIGFQINEPFHLNMISGWSNISDMLGDFN